MNTVLKESKIKSRAYQEKLPTLKLGLSLFAGAFILSLLFWPEFKLQLIAFYLLAIVTTFLGIVKYFEPEYCLVLDEQGLTYCHRQGQWTIAWQNIQQVYQPKFSHGLESKPIPYIGIRLIDNEAPTNSVSPRLANHLIHEQRGLMVLALQVQSVSWQETQMNFEPFTMKSGHVVKGPTAAWLHQMQILRLVYGCDLYVPCNSFKQEADEIIALFKSYP